MRNPNSFHWKKGAKCLICTVILDLLNLLVDESAPWKKKSEQIELNPDQLAYGRDVMHCVNIFIKRP